MSHLSSTWEAKTAGQGHTYKSFPQITRAQTPRVDCDISHLTFCLQHCPFWHRFNQPFQSLPSFPFQYLKPFSYHSWTPMSLLPV